MAGHASVRFDIPRWQNDIRRFERETGLSAMDLYREAYRMLVETMYHWTAPPTKGRGSSGGHSGARKRSRALIGADIAKTTRGMSPGYIQMLMNVAGGSYIESLTLKNKAGQEYTLRNITLDPGGNRVDSHHQSRRRFGGRRSGRVPGRMREDEWQQNKVYTIAQNFQRTQKNMMARVGKLKAGWTPALSQLGSKLPQAWVVKAGRISGASGAASGSGPGNAFVYTEDSMNAGSAVSFNTTGYFRDDSMESRAHADTMRFLDRRGQQWIDRRISIANQRAAQEASA
jgi:hypothetical protein